MALMRCSAYSSTLELTTSFTVLVPERSDRPGGMRVLYLLHGLTDDDTSWTRMTAVERYVEGRDLVVVMPAVHHSFYADQVVGLPFWTYVTDELPAVVASMLRVSTERADTYVAGLSMGGYGAMRWALLQPERFAAAASLSGALALSDAHGRQDPWFRALLDRSFGPGGIDGTDADLSHLIRTSDPDRLPALYAACGTEDFLLGATEAFAATCGESGVATTVRYGPGGHEWAYWDRQIQDVLDWLPLT